MPDNKKPSEKVEELCQAYNKILVKTRSQHEIDELEKNRLNDTITLILSFIDNQSSQIQSLRKEVKELKTKLNSVPYWYCGHCHIGSFTDELTPCQHK